MELLIPGLIIVAVMVWASTRIKRNAAAAFDRERIETPDFTIDKPDGWLSLVEPTKGRLFEAYSKDFGTNAAENIRLGTADITVSGGSIRDAIAASTDGAKLLEDRREVVNEVKYRVVEWESSDDDATYQHVAKVADDNGKVYTLHVRTLVDATDEFRRGVEEMTDSFVLK